MRAIEVHDLGKKYRRFDARRPSTLQEAVLSGFNHLQRGDARWSLRHVSFQLLQGRVLGVIGRNGAGKSTLLRLIGGVLRPDEGAVKVCGKLGGLLELTAGFHADLTGRENTEIGGILRGLTRAEVRRRFDSIVDFSELREAIDRPLRTYSTGMQMRLAFAVAIHCEPDVLLVDEVLAVGDAAFQSKCLDRIRQLRSRGCSILLVSHDISLVQHMCDEALWLKDGSVAASGSVGEVANEYTASLRNETVLRTSVDAQAAVTSQGVVLRLGKNRFGALEFEITDVRVRTASDASGLELSDGDSLSVEMDYVVNQAVDMPIFSVTVIHDDGSVCMSATTEEIALELPANRSSGHITVRWSQVAVEPGTYFVEVGAYRKDWAYAYDYHARSYPVVVRQYSLSSGPSRIAGRASRAEWIYNDSPSVLYRESRVFEVPAEIPGLNLNIEGQIETIKAIAPYCVQSQFGRSENVRFRTPNDNFSAGEAVIYFGILNWLKPSILIEVGSGYTTTVALDALDFAQKADTILCCIEPFPELLKTLLRPGDEQRLRIMHQELQDVNRGVFQQLRAGDVLFVDSTHVSKIGSDVHTLIFEILPLLASGVYVHIHDIYYPFEYPREWLLQGRAWNEAYVVRAFLQYNSAFEIVFFNSYLAQLQPALCASIPQFPQTPGSGLWLRKR